MRFTSFIVSGLFAVAAAQSTSTTASVSPAQASEAACLKSCGVGNVDCQARCISVPSPNAAQVNATTACVAKCPQGDGSASQTQAYADCSAACIRDNYFATSAGTPQPTGTPSGGSGSGSSSDSGSGSSSDSGSSTGSDSGSDSTSVAVPTASSSGDGSATQTSDSSSTQTSSAAASASTTANAAPVIAGSGAALFGVVAALLAL